MEMFAKIGDAAGMLWQALDTHEKLLLAWLGASLIMLALAPGAERRREQRIADRVTEQLRAR